MNYTEASQEVDSRTGAIGYISLRTTAFGEVRPERLQILRDAAPNPDDPQGLVPVFNEQSGGEIVSLSNAGEDHSTFVLTVGSTEAVAYCLPGEEAIGIYQRVDHPNETAVTKLEGEMRVLCDSLLAPGFTIEPNYCTVAVDMELSESLDELVPDIITRARNMDVDNFEFMCGSESGGADARLFENSRTGSGHEIIKTLELTLHRGRLRDFAPVLQAHEGGIHGLVEGTLGYMFGNERFVDPFIRIATSESRGNPNFMRPNSIAFEAAKASAFESLASDRQTQGSERAKATNGLLGLFGIRR